MVGVYEMVLNLGDNDQFPPENRSRIIFSKSNIFQIISFGGSKSTTARKFLTESSATETRNQGLLKTIYYTCCSCMIAWKLYRTVQASNVLDLSLALF